MYAKNGKRFAVWSKVVLVLITSLLISGSMMPPTSSVQGHGSPLGTPMPSGGGGGQIAFMSNRDGNLEIYEMDADGRNPHNLTNTQAEDSDPAWSPDGK